MLDEARQSESVGEKAYQRIRADIVCGRLAPGERLTLDRMRDAYEVSVGTLRETLNRLSSERLIVAEGSRGFQVAPISAADLREVAAMRCLLELHALRLSFEVGDMEWEGAVVAAHHKLASMERGMKSGERTHAQTWKRYDREFHRALISACGSQVLLDTHALIYDRYLRYQMVAAVYRGDVAAGEHGRLLNCALKRDWKGAQSTLTKHVQDCVQHMIEKRLVP
ncbi:GntR family transcriptional regulator [Variovorax soli]|uniref:DNA-binding GntR family transcriptional regulator n=1 Tax=Variovorax soli TaxID=376815 RepID=A0ABU1NJG4_9BURK|nr:GntR family transcriptional regulator [Variovorax soli]MDR6538587.1 DNA-binding GntR family transcriptional regulator [Variovorax soli]